MWRKSHARSDIEKIGRIMLVCFFVCKLLRGILRLIWGSGRVSLQIGLAAVVIVVTLIGVAVGRYPRLRMNRATIALVGATLLIVMGAISLDEAYASLDMNTLALLFAMMVINVNLRLAGFFRLVGSEVIRLARTPRQLLAWIVIASGVLSALFLNDTIVLMLTPLVLEIAVALKRNPIPYLIGLVTAANIGSAATIVGNPQNMIIGVASQIPFAAFTLRLAPASLVGLAVAWGILALVYRREITGAPFPADVSLPWEPIYRPLLQKSLIAVVLMLIAFLAGAPVALAALAAACLLLITRRIKPQRVFNEVDVSLLVFFSGLFIVTGAIEQLGISEWLFALGRPLASQGIP
ncbi:MAG: inner membrane protein YbiR, partial [Chloroflexota bacterium]|nr:inner membrane protein YbiR [Chloroflexota bacterium]